MKLTYWYAECLNDSDVFAVREKTKKAAIAELDGRHESDGYGPVIKVSIEYDNAFDLMEECSDQYRTHWESQATIDHLSLKPGSRASSAFDNEED